LNLPAPAVLLYALLGISALFIALIVARPSITVTREGKILAFIAFLILPTLCVAWGGTEHIERSKQTKFCITCHIMEPYGRSLYVDDKSFIPAQHFQNHRIPVDVACFTCHTDYALYGDIRAKLRGLHHIYVQYIGKPPRPEDIKLYTPYNNRECLHCHLGARSFMENETHQAILDSLTSNQLSCLSTGCHDSIHNVDTLGKVKFWSPSR
jgi:cytochrome c-type protein NapC